MDSALCEWLTSPQTSPVFSVLLLEPFLEPQLYMNQSMVTSTVLSITKQGGFEFLCGRFFSVIFRERCYSIRKILIHIHATSPTTSRRLTRPHQCSGRLLSTCCFFALILQILNAILEMILCSNHNKSENPFQKYDFAKN